MRERSLITAGVFRHMVRFDDLMILEENDEVNIVSNESQEMDKEEVKETKSEKGKNEE